MTSYPPLNTPLMYNGDLTSTVEDCAFTVQQVPVLVVRQMLLIIRRTVLCPVRCTVIRCTDPCPCHRL